MCLDCFFFITLKLDKVKQRTGKVKTKDEEGIRREKTQLNKEIKEINLAKFKVGLYRAQARLEYPAQKLGFKARLKSSTQKLDSKARLDTTLIQGQGSDKKQ